MIIMFSSPKFINCFLLSSTPNISHILWTGTRYVLSTSKTHLYHDVIHIIRKPSILKPSMFFLLSVFQGDWFICQHKPGRTLCKTELVTNTFCFWEFMCYVLHKKCVFQNEFSQVFLKSFTIYFLCSHKGLYFVLYTPAIAHAQYTNNYSKSYNL